VEFLNLSFYKFVDVADPQGKQSAIRAYCRESCPQLRGTVLLGPEGINSFVAGPSDEAEAFLGHLDTYPEFSDLFVKRSVSSGKPPYSRLLVKVKDEIIPLGVASVQPHRRTGRRLDPAHLKEWFDTNKEFAILDTRNAFEVELGTFRGSLDLKLKNFREFSKKIDELPPDTRAKPLVMFCTGGIRCEKATALALEKGYSDVYQLDGGILNYFEKCGSAHFDGDCFVFDKRVALAGDLKPSGRKACFECRQVLKSGEEHSCAKASSQVRG
jgi:UPF0176 protein